MMSLRLPWSKCVSSQSLLALPMMSFKHVQTHKKSNRKDDRLP